jgi:hypothetical protein
MKHLLSLLLVLACGLPALADGDAISRSIAGALVPGKRARHTINIPPGATACTVVVAAGFDATLAYLDAGDVAASDDDSAGFRGAEQAAFVIPRAGTYEVRVETYSASSTACTVGASWLPMLELAEAPREADDRPDGAVAMGLGGTTQQQLHAAGGDREAWHRLVPAKAGRLAVSTTGQADLRLEMFDEGLYDSALEYSDQDLDGSLGNEAITIPVEAGRAYYPRVSPITSSQDVLPYELTTRLEPR